VNAFVVALYALTIYGAATILHFFLQVIFAQRSRSIWANEGSRYSVRMVVPTYREEPDLLRRCLASIAHQGASVTTVVLSNDDENDHYVEQIFEEVRSSPLVMDTEQVWLYRAHPHNGKRDAMYDGAHDAVEDLVVFMDSDTIISREDSVHRLIQPFHQGNVGCATGEVTVTNHQDNLLTRITNLRYWLSFNLERAAQSYFGVMSCVSGPFGAYRRVVLDSVLETWRSQTFLGNKCTFGDDRHLTSLVLRAGYKSVYVPDATAETKAPRSLRSWLKQQLRWSRSFYREYLLGVRSFNIQSAWLAYDLTYQGVFPFFVAANLAIIFYLGVAKNWKYFLVWLVVIGVFGLLRALYGLVVTKRIGFLAFTVYGYLFAIVLLPLKILACATVFRTGWEKKREAVPTP
jgi:hyaluronan synthase/N-acetylglucosaminyltransferase